MLDETLKQIEAIFSDSSSTKWLNSDHVRDWCEDRRKEEEMERRPVPTNPATRVAFRSGESVQFREMGND